MKIAANEEFNERCRLLAEKHGFNLYDIALWDNGEVYYFEYTPANACNNSHSVSKMFTMAAVGMLVDDGKLSLDDGILPILADEIGGSAADGWEKVTVRHALAHKTGIDRDAPADEEVSMAYDENDFLSRVFSERIVHTPGEYYCYSDGVYYILSRIVAKIAGKKLDDFLTDRLFRPLGFSEPAWGKCPFGYPLGGDSLYCRTVDMLTLPVIFLNGGEFEGRRYLSEDWVKTAMRESLGMLPCENKTFGKTGARGQLAAFCPDTNRALAMHAFQSNGNYDFRGAVIREILEK